MFQKEKTIAIIPHLGYRIKANQSHCAYQWLAHVAHENNVVIRHGRNEGEKRVGPYLLDGYCEATNTAMSFMAAFFMAVSNVFPAPP